MRLITRSAVRRLAVLFVVGGCLLWLCGCMMISMPGKSFRGPLPPLTAEQVRLRDELRGHVEKLGREIGERNVFQPKKLHAAADYIEGVFTNAGYKVTRQTYVVDGESCANIIAELPGAARRDEIVVVGAHYDSVAGCPGANDNGSGVAGTLALARLWAKRTPERTVRFVAFVNEEPPFFQTESMGSLVYAKQCQKQGDKITAMLSLETIGYYSDEKGTQKYPAPFGMFYPSTGNFIGFAGNVSNRKLVRQCVKIFRENAQFPSEGGALPGWLPGIGWSDHWSFWQAGYPGVIVSDTATFRYPHYHTTEDLAEKLDYERMGRVIEGVDSVVKDLAGAK